MGLPTTAFAFLAAALSWAALQAHAEEVPAAIAPPISGLVELGLARETSTFTQVRIGDSPAILIPGDNVRRAELFTHFSGTLNGAVPCGIAGFTCVADATYDTHTGRKSGDVDTAIAQGDVGLQKALGSSVAGMKLVREYWKVGGSEFRRVHGVSFDVASGWNERLSSYVLLNLYEYRHPGEQSALDARYRALTGNVRWAPQDSWKSGYTLQATVSREDNRDNDPTLDVRGVLLRAAWDAKPAEGWEAGVSTIVQRLRFGAFDPILGVRREDRYTGLELQLARRIAKNVNLRLDLGYARYRSSASAFDNDWYSTGLLLIWKF